MNTLSLQYLAKVAVDKEFMVTFYKNWLEGKMSIPEAFRATQKEMRERFINPYVWAGFVLVE